MRLLYSNYESCKACTPETGRHPGCHSTCEKYQTERARHDELKNKYMTDHKAEGYFVESIKNGKAKRWKKKF